MVDIDRVINRLDGTEISMYLLEELVEETEFEVLDYTHQTELNKALEAVAVALTVIKVQRLGTESLKSESYSGVSTSYLEELPDHLQRILNSNTRLAGWD